MKHSGKTEQRPKFRLPFSAVLLYLLLIAAAVSGVTFSKYVTGTTVGDTARVAIMRDITVTETGNFAETDKWVITPGVDMIKNAVVNFEGSEMTCYVFCEIKTTGWSRLNDNYSFAFSGGARVRSKRSGSPGPPHQKEVPTNGKGRRAHQDHPSVL